MKIQEPVYSALPAIRASIAPRNVVPFLFVALALVVLFSRLPFLNAGYGVHMDAWRIANAASYIGQGNGYTASRLPGYPVQEFACALAWRGGPVALNGLSAVFSAVSAIFFALSLRELRCRDWLLGALALAFIPVVYVSSVTTKDYLWALALLLIAFYAILKERPLLAGIALGLAIGCRITSGAALFPLAILLAAQGGESCFKRLMWFACSAGIVGVLVFLPVAAVYGLGFFSFAQHHDYPTPAILLSRSTLEVFGPLGLAGIVVAAAGAVWRNSPMLFKRVPLTDPQLPRHLVTALTLAIFIFVCGYLQLPDQAGYLIPVLPFLLILLARFAPRAWFQFAAVCLIASSFVSFNGRELTTGAIFADRHERLATMETVSKFLEFAEQMEGENLIVVGAWEPQIAAMTFNRKLRQEYRYLLNHDELLAVIHSGKPIYTTSLIRAFNQRVNGIDLARYGAIDIQPLAHQWLAAKRTAAQNHFTLQD